MKGFNDVFIYLLSFLQREVYYFLDGLFLGGLHFCKYIFCENVWISKWIFVVYSFGIIQFLNI